MESYACARRLISKQTSLNSVVTGIDVGLLTRATAPIGSMRSHVDDEDGGGAIFSGDCPEFLIELAGGERLLVLGNHFKSKGFGSASSSASLGSATARQTGDHNMLNRRGFMVGAATGVGAMAVMSAEIVTAAAPGGKVSLNVIYPNHEGAKFDTAYYRATHIPLVMKVMKADSVLLIEGMPMGTAAAPYVMIAHFEFASLEALQTAQANPAMTEVRADVARFTDIKPTLMLGKPL